jgi:molecular chaperone HtpG
MNQPWKRRIPFQVDITGIIEIMGVSLYSKVTTPIREMIQNSHDAIIRRRQRDLSYKGEIRILQDASAHTLSFEDDGIGLNEKEAETYLGTLGIGITGLIKKNLLPSTPEDRQDLIGQFGIGLFSGFLLADRLVVETRRADEEQAIRWETSDHNEIELSSCSREKIGDLCHFIFKKRTFSFCRVPRTFRRNRQRICQFLTYPSFFKSRKNTR